MRREIGWAAGGWKKAKRKRLGCKEGSDIDCGKRRLSSLLSSRRKMTGWGERKKEPVTGTHGLGSRGRGFGLFLVKKETG